MSLPILGSRNVTQDLYTQALASVYLSGWRVYESDYASLKDADIYEKARRDPVVAQAFDIRLHAVAGRQWRFVPASDAPDDKLLAKMAEQAFRQIRDFSEARYELAQAKLRNSAWAFIEGGRRIMSLAGTPIRDWWVPKRLKDIDRRRFRIKSDWDYGKPADPKLDAYWELYDPRRRAWERLAHPELFVNVVFNDEEARLGYGRGLLESIYFYLWIKGRVLEEGIKGLIGWARGKVVAKIDGLAPGSPDRTNDDLTARWLEALKSMLDEQVLVHGKNDEVQLIETTGTGHQMVTAFLGYLDNAVRACILGSTLPFGGDGGDAGGSLARAETESDTHDALIQFDREKIDEVLTNSVGALWLRLNRQNFVELGVGGAQPPRFETYQEKREDPEKNVRVIQTANSAGIDLKKEEVYQKIGFTPPGLDDEIIKGREAPLPGAGGPFGGGGFFDSPDFERTMPDREAAQMARGFIRAGLAPEAAIRCAIEARHLDAIPPPPAKPERVPDIHISSPVTVNNPAPVQALAAPQSGPALHIAPSIHLPDSIKLEAMNPKQPDVVVNVAPSPAPNVTVLPPEVKIAVAAPNVSVAAPEVHVAAPEVKVDVAAPPPAQIEVVLKPTPKDITFKHGKDGGISGATIEPKGAA